MKITIHLNNEALAAVAEQTNASAESALCAIMKCTGLDIASEGIGKPMTESVWHNGARIGTFTVEPEA